MIFNIFGDQSCLVVALVVWWMFARNAIIFRIQDMFMISDFKVSPKNSFETAEFWCIVNLRTILCLLQRKNSTFP